MVYNKTMKTLILISGVSGAGKTTFLKLLLGLLHPVSGGITLEVNGETIEVSDSTRRFFSYVPQESSLFAGTVAENLRIVAPQASDDDLMNALRLACIDSFVSEQPDGLEFMIGESGDNLSRGQLQRFLIARAILRDAPIILLDEATSALDPQTETAVLSNIIHDDPKKIVILTTHKSSVLKHCSRIYRVTGDGHFEETD